MTWRGVSRRGDTVLVGQVVQVNDQPSGRMRAGDTALTPTQPVHRVRPVSNRALTVHFPVVQTRPVRAQVAGLAENAPGGLTLELREDAGQVTAATMFADSAWYVA